MRCVAGLTTLCLNRCERKRLGEGVEWGRGLEQCQGLSPPGSFESQRLGRGLRPHVQGLRSLHLVRLDGGI